MANRLENKCNTGEMRWYVVSTKPNREKQTEMNIERLGVGCFLPLLQEQRIIRRKRRTTVMPLFPGYLFVRINISEHYRAVSYARGVRRIVEFGSGPVEIDASTIEAIRSKMVHSNIVRLEKATEFHAGHLIQIKDGPLMGLEAVFMREMPGHQRAMVLLHTLSLQARVVLGVDQIATSSAA